MGLTRSLAEAKSFLSGQQRQDQLGSPPIFLRFRSSRTFILSTVAIAVFTDIFLYGLIIPVLPFSLTTRAGVAPDDVQSWTSTLLAVYGAALVTFSPVVGWYADNSSSRRLPLLFGLLVLLGATLLLCLSTSIALLIVGRLLQGFSAAVVWVVGCALMVDTVGEAEVGQQMGYVSISMSMGVLIAPLLGGVVYQQAGYYATFYLSFGTIALDILLRLLLIEKKIAQQWEPAPSTGAVDNGADKDCPGRDVSRQPQVCHDAESIARMSRDGTPEDANAVDCETAKDQGNLASEPMTTTEQFELRTHRTHSRASAHRRTTLPMLTLLKSRRMLTALWGCLMQATIMTSFDAVLPLFVEETFGWDSTAAGLIFLALYLPSLVAPAVGWVSDRWGSRWPAVAGFIICIPFLVLLRLVTADTMSQKVLLCALLAFIGLCLVLMLGPLMAEITYIVEALDRQHPGIFGPTGAYAQAYGLFIMSWAGGCLAGPLLAGFVRDRAGWGTATWSLAVLSVAGAVPVFLWTGGSFLDMRKVRRSARTDDTV